MKFSGLMSRWTMPSLRHSEKRGLSPPPPTQHKKKKKRREKKRKRQKRRDSESREHNTSPLGLSLATRSVALSLRRSVALSLRRRALQSRESATHERRELCALECKYSMRRSTWSATSTAVLRATNCRALQSSAKLCEALQSSAKLCKALQSPAKPCKALQRFWMIKEFVFRSLEQF